MGEEGRTSLYSGAAANHAAVVELLLEADADANKADGQGSSPLMVAAQEGHDAVVEMLLRAGSMVDQTKGETFTLENIP